MTQPICSKELPRTADPHHRKTDGKPTEEKQPQQPKRIDQNALGEGQFFGQNPKPQGVINGSIRSVSRAGTPQQPPPGSRALYANHDTHNLAAASMFDLSTVGPARRGSQASIALKPHASDINMRTRFGANNGSSTSLAAPAPGFAPRFGPQNRSSTSLVAPAPGFGPRYGATNGSSTSLAAPGPGFGSRPGTPNRTKAWVNPLDVHFVRSVPSGPPTPRSPLVDSIQLPPTPTTDNAETGSVFGEEADDMVDAVMASVKKREQEEREAKKREKELERLRETARLDMERLERQKSTESNLSGRRPSAPQLEPEPQPTFAEISALQGPVFRSDAGSRPGSRNGPVWSPPLHQGPPPTGPPTQCLPQLPGQGPPRQGPLGHASEDPSRRGPRQNGTAANSPGPGPRPNGAQQSPSNRPHPGPPAQGASSRSPGPTAQAPPQKAFRPYRPPPLQGCGALGPLPDGLRSPSPPLSTPVLDSQRSQSPAIRSAPAVQHRPAMFNAEPEIPPRNDRRGTPGPEGQGRGPLLSTLTSPPSTVTSPTVSIRGLSLDDGPIEQFARPIIRDVIAKRDTLTLITPRQHSLSMKIEELEKTLLNAQKTNQAQKLQAPDANTRSIANRRSTSSSIYSDGIHDEDEDDDGPILSIEPAPLRVAPTTAPPAPVTAAVDRPQSPMRGPPRRGPLPRRPGLEEYGVSQTGLRSRGGTPTPASRNGSTDNYSSHSSPPSRTNTPQIRHPNWRRDMNQPSPAPTLDTSEPPRPNPVLDTGFKFDFGPGPNLGAPPTPDSTTWSLASPTIEIAPAPPPFTSEPAHTQSTAEPPAKFTRANVPPPLNLTFNFSPDAPSRDPGAGLWTPPIQPGPTVEVTVDERPTTSSGPGNNSGSSKLAASPSLISQFPDSHLRVDNNRASWMGIGMARGPSIREVRPTRPGGKKQPGMVDSFGTGFI